MKIEKRLPFGFLGDWGKLYKRYTSNEEIKIGADVVKYQNNNYIDIGQDVQFKEATDTETSTDTPHTGLINLTSYLSVKTTDAYFNDIRKEYVCIVEPGDIVKVFGRQWIVTSVREKIARRTPAPQKIFYCELKSTK